MTPIHVLISRPAIEAAELADIIRTPGCIPLVLPAFGFSASGERVTPDAEWRSARVRLAVFTSPRAVTFGVPACEPGLLEDSMIAAIGPATARALEAAGLPVSVRTRGRSDSESLLSSPDLPSIAGVALIFAAPGGRDALQEGLQRLGWEVRVALVYRRCEVSLPPAVVDELSGAGSLASVWTSGNALRRLLGELPEAAVQKILRAPMVVASRRLASIAEHAGARNVHLARGADNASLASVIRQLVTLPETD